jgi:hypothetical protein
MLLWLSEDVPESPPLLPTTRYNAA